MHTSTVYLCREGEKVTSGEIPLLQNSGTLNSWDMCKVSRENTLADITSAETISITLDILL